MLENKFYGMVMAMDKVSETIYNPDGTVLRKERLEKEEKSKRAWLRVFAWQCAVSTILCLGATGLRRYDPDRAETVRTLLVAEEEDPISRAAQCFLENIAAGEPVGDAVAAFCGELVHYAGS